MLMSYHDIASRLVSRWRRRDRQNWNALVGQIADALRQAQESLYTHALKDVPNYQRRVEAITSRLRTLSSGPWTAQQVADHWDVCQGDLLDYDSPVVTDGYMFNEASANAAFLAAAREDVPFLLDVIQNLHGHLALLARDNDSWRDGFESGRRQGSPEISQVIGEGITRICDMPVGSYAYLPTHSVSQPPDRPSGHLMLDVRSAVHCQPVGGHFIRVDRLATGYKLTLPSQYVPALRAGAGDPNNFVPVQIIVWI